MATASIRIRIIGVRIQKIGILWLYSTDLIVWQDSTMNGRVNHDSTVDVDLDNLSLLLDVSHSLMTLVVDALQRDEFLATGNKISS